MNRLDERLMASVVYRRVAPLLIVAALVLAIAASAGTYFNGRADARRNNEQAATNQANAVTSCQNANESREASRTLWFFVVDLASKGAPPERAAYLEKVREWIGEVYQPHDCTDLSKKYPLPPPPAIPADS